MPLRCLTVAFLSVFLAGCRSPREVTAWNELQEVKKALNTEAGLSGPLLDPDAPAIPAEGDLDAYLKLAFIQSPDMKRGFEEWQAALQEAPQVFSLPDPTLSFGVYAQEVETRVGSQRLRLGVRQKIPWIPKLFEARDVALAAADMAEASFLSKKLRLFERVGHAFSDYAYNARAVTKTGEILQLLIQLEAVAQARLQTQAGQADLIRVQVEIGRVEDHLANLKDQRRPLSDRLRAALGLAPGPELLPEPATIPVLIPPSDSDFILLSQMEERNPELLLIEQKIAKAREAEQLADQGWFPDFTVGVDWIETDGAEKHGVDDSGKDPVVVSLGINLPIFTGRIGAKIEQARARKRAATWELSDKRHQLEAELSRARFELRDARRRLYLYRDTLIPKQTQSLNVTQITYEAGGLDFLSVIEAERTLLEFMLQLERSRTDALKALSTMERLLGSRFERSEAP